MGNNAKDAYNILPFYSCNIVGSFANELVNNKTKRCYAERSEVSLFAVVRFFPAVRMTMVE
jgi:hypothetical protein